MKSKIYDPKLKIWSGEKADSIYNPNLGLGYLILNVFKNTPERVTQVSADTGVEITCHEMRIRTMKIAKHLMEAGYKQGDIVGIMASNSENLAPVFFACLTLGLPINTLAPIMLESDIVHMYSRTKPKVVFCDAEIVGIVRSGMQKIGSKSQIYTLQEKIEGHVFVDDILQMNFDEHNFVMPRLKDIASSIALIVCSSGTTGLPKGVCKSHAQIITQEYFFGEIDATSQNVMFNFSTLYWVSGTIFLIVGTLYGAKRVITSKPFDADLFINIINRFKVTTTMLPPSGVNYILRCKNMKTMPSIKNFLVGGSAISKQNCLELKSFLKNGEIVCGYGTSEGDLLTLFRGTQELGSSGKPAYNVQIKIVDKAGNCLGPNEKGEIWYKTPVMFSGYFDEPERTKEASRDCWMISGDIGYFNDDGFIFIVDRMKDMLKFNNYQVSPSELETIIDEIDGVENSCVVGIFEENKGNDLIFGFVVKDPVHSKLSEDDVLKHVHSKVIDAKKLRGGVHFLDEFPMTPSGKIQRVLVKNIAENMLNSSIKRD